MEVQESFASLPVVHAPYLDHEPIGADDLDALHRACTGDRRHRPAHAARRCEGMTVTRTGRRFVLRLPLPLVSAADVDLGRRGDELVVTVGEHRRLLSLPAALRRCVVTGASVRDGRLRVTVRPGREGVAPRWLSRRTPPRTVPPRGTVADETARLVEALGVWATSASSASGTRPRHAPVRRRRPTPPHGSGPAEAPTTTRAAGRRPGHADDARRARAGRGETPDDVGPLRALRRRDRCGPAISCQVCPICQGIALLRTVRPETVDRLADLAGAVAATLRDVAAHVRTGATAEPPAHGPDSPAAGRCARTGLGRTGAPRGPATVQDIPVDDGDTTDEGDEL